MYHVYIIQSYLNGRFYIGYTNNITNRLKRHNEHPDSYTKNRGPWKLVYCEKFHTQTKALLREKQIKSYKGGKAFKKLLFSEQKIVQAFKG